MDAFCKFLIEPLSLSTHLTCRSVADVHGHFKGVPTNWVEVQSHPLRYIELATLPYHAGTTTPVTSPKPNSYNLPEANSRMTHLYKSQDPNLDIPKGRCLQFVPASNTYNVVPLVPMPFLEKIEVDDRPKKKTNAILHTPPQGVCVE